MDGSSAPSQSQAAKPPQIFAGLRIFVQASGIGTDRPRFIRTLKVRLSHPSVPTTNKAFTGTRRFHLLYS